VVAGRSVLENLELQRHLAGTNCSKNKLAVLSQALARTLVAAPRLVAGRSVLEVGAGVGLAGLLAARLGAAQVPLAQSPPFCSIAQYALVAGRCVRRAGGGRRRRASSLPPHI